MSFWLITLGLLLILVGWSIVYDDLEYTRLLELEEMEREASPELYEDPEWEKFEARWGALATPVALVITVFYNIRGFIVGLSGVMLTAVKLSEVLV